MKGAKNQIPEDDIIPVVRISFFENEGMVPAVELSHAENIIEPSEAKMNITVLK